MKNVTRVLCFNTPSKSHGYTGHEGTRHAPCLVRFGTRTHLPSGGCVVCHRADTVATGYLPNPLPRTIHRDWATQSIGIEQPGSSASTPRYSPDKKRPRTIHRGWATQSIGIESKDDPTEGQCPQRAVGAFLGPFRHDEASALDVLR